MDYKGCWFFGVRCVVCTRIWVLKVQSVVFTFNSVFFNSLFEGLEFCVEDFRVDVLSLLQMNNKNVAVVQNDSENKCSVKYDLSFLVEIHTKM